MISKTAQISREGAMQIVRYVSPMGMSRPSFAKWTNFSETSPGQVAGSFDFDVVGQVSHKDGYLLFG